MEVFKKMTELSKPRAIHTEESNLYSPSILSGIAHIGMSTIIAKQGLQSVLWVLLQVIQDDQEYFKFILKKKC